MQKLGIAKVNDNNTVQFVIFYILNYVWFAEVLNKTVVGMVRENITTPKTP